MPRLATIIICLFLSLILGFFLIWPKYQDFRELQFKIRGKRIEIENQEKYFLNLSDLSEKLEKYKSELSKINSALPKEPFLPSLLDFLQKASAQNGLVFKKLGAFSITLPRKTAETPGPSPEKEKTEFLPEVKEISVDFEVSGSYSALKNFLLTLEKIARLIEIESISFFLEKEGLSSFNLRIKTYSY